MKKSPLKRGTSQLKRTPLKRTPMKRTKTRSQSDYDRELDAMKVDVIRRSKGNCEAVGPRFLPLDGSMDATAKALIEGCTGHGVHVHHRKYRSRGGTNSLENLINICLNCHDWIHAHGGFGEPANLLRLALSAGESEEL